AALHLTYLSRRPRETIGRTRRRGKAALQGLLVPGPRGHYACRTSLNGVMNATGGRKAAVNIPQERSAATYEISMVHRIFGGGSTGLDSRTRAPSAESPAPS